MKTYVLIISEKFPIRHPKAGEKTYFTFNINHVHKLHTLRLNYPLWEKRIKEVQRGEAVISLRTWLGKPYNSKQLEQLCFDKTSNIGIEKLVWLDGFEPTIGPYPIPLNVLTTNDGLSTNDFLDWFPILPKEPMAIIHFTKFRYNEK